MNIRVHIEDHIIELISDSNSSSPSGDLVYLPQFRIMGRRIGVTTLYVSNLFFLEAIFLDYQGF